MENMKVACLYAQSSDVNEGRKVHDFRLSSALAVPLQVSCGFLGLPFQDGVGNLISENKKLEEPFSHTSHI